MVTELEEHVTKTGMESDFYTQSVTFLVLSHPTTCIT